jgi:IS30 family transposase
MRRPRGQRAATGVLERPSRKDRVRQIEALARQGLEVREIADQVGLAVSTVHKYRRDPDGESERARRESYRGRCGVCGRATSGSEGPGRAPRWCRDHAPAQRRRWSDEQLLEAIRDWARLTGAPPTVYDWSPAHAPEGHAGAARYLDELGRWPNARSVARRFGSLAAAVRRADLRS